MLDYFVLLFNFFFFQFEILDYPLIIGSSSGIGGGIVLMVISIFLIKRKRRKETNNIENDTSKSKNSKRKYHTLC